MLPMQSIDLIELDYLSTLEIIGEGAIDLLQGQITSDMEKVTDSISSLGALCNIKGRVESSFLVIKKPNFKNTFLLIGNKEVMEGTEAILRKYSPFYTVEMRMNEEHRFVGINEKFLVSDFSETNLGLSVQSHKKFVRIHYLHKKFHLLLLDKHSTCFDSVELSKDINEWEKDNIINKDFNLQIKDVNKFTPHELGYHHTNRIDFEKGCYTGQEIVARMHYRAKKLPFLLIGRSQNNDTISSEIFNLEGNKVGLVLSEVKQEHSRLCLFSMNKNYDGGEVRFQDSSVITFE